MLRFEPSRSPGQQDGTQMCLKNSYTITFSVFLSCVSVCHQRLCSVLAYSQPTHQHTTFIGKQRQMLSSVLPGHHFSPLPPVSVSVILSLGMLTHFIRIVVCLSQFLCGHPGAQVPSGMMSICMEIAFSHGMHWGHSSTSTLAAGTYRDPADVRNVSVFVQLYI